MASKQEVQAFTVLPCKDLQADIAFFTNELGMQLLRLYPAEKPHLAELSGSGLSISLDSRYNGEPGRLLIKSDHSSRESIRSPSGTEIVWEFAAEQRIQRVSKHQVEVCTLRSTPWVSGRAGTQLRDLIPSRLGGGVSVSHIRMPNGGPVRDRVHYHTAKFQMVFCVQGWITLVYEDQGSPITLQAGDCVTQPPYIRHRVAETSNGLEVIEISSPAEHMTTIDNELELPTERVNSHRQFDGQRFCHFKINEARWLSYRLPGIVAADTGVAAASGGLAGVHLLKSSGESASYITSHNAEALFSFVVGGSVRINRQLMVAGDAFTLPPDEQFTVSDISDDVYVLEVSLPGQFETELY